MYQILFFGTVFLCVDELWKWIGHYVVSAKLMLVVKWGIQLKASEKIKVQDMNQYQMHFHNSMAAIANQWMFLISLQTMIIFDGEKSKIS